MNPPRIILLSASTKTTTNKQLFYDNPQCLICAPKSTIERYRENLNRIRSSRLNFLP